MKNKNFLIISLAFVLLLAACAPKAVPTAEPETAPPQPAATTETQDYGGGVATEEPILQPTAEPLAVTEGDPVNVAIAGFKFDSRDLVIHAGTTVTWTNKDSAPHTATADDGAFDSGRLGKGGSFSFTFNEAGTYAYHCDFHSSMTATITVVP